MRGKKLKSQRLKYAILNSSILTTIQILTVIIKFITQTFFIHYLGSKFLGLNGLFTNILSILSFAELGIGTAITFSLYEPLAKSNKHEIAALMHFFRKAYRYIGITIAIFGLGILPLLKILIKDYSSMHNVEYYYVLYLTNAVVSYFFTYKRTLLIADQHEYISSLNQLGFTLIQIVLQILALVMYQSYAAYLWIAIFCTILSNLAISHYVNNKYDYLEELKQSAIDNQKKRIIKHNVIGMVGSKIGSIAVRSTDNLLLSMFLGISIVGIYSNYLLIVMSIGMILNRLVSSVTASIGNLMIEKNSDKSISVFNKHYMINFIMVSISTGCLLVSLNPFITFWVGKNYVLDFSVVIIIAVNYYIDQIRQTNITFISAYGLFVSNGKKSVIEAILNLLLSLTFLNIFDLGIKGVLMGTIVTNLILNSWWEPWLLFKKGINNMKHFQHYYFSKYLLNSLTMFLVIYITTEIIREVNIHFPINPLFEAFINSILMIIVLVIYILSVYRKNEALVFIRLTVKGLIKKS